MFYCGIDVGKSKHAVALLSERGQVHQPAFSIENTQAGLDFLVEALKRLDGEVTVGLEATGHYWLSLFDVLTKNGYRVVVINPLQVAAFRRSGIRKVKNDRSDAVWVADFLRIANLPSTGLTVDPIIDTYDNLPNMLIEQCCTPMNFDSIRMRSSRSSVSLFLRTISPLAVVKIHMGRPARRWGRWPPITAPLAGYFPIDGRIKKSKAVRFRLRRRTASLTVH